MSDSKIRIPLESLEAVGEDDKTWTIRHLASDKVAVDGVFVAPTAEAAVRTAEERGLLDPAMSYYAAEAAG